MVKVYTNDGHCLGEEWVNLAGLQLNTKEAIEQMIYLDKTLDVYNDRINKSETETLEIVDSCFHAFASPFRAEATTMARDLLNGTTE